MAGANNIPERLINFRVYSDNDDLLGLATVDLPEIEAMSDTISGAGIAGELETPTIGHYAAMESTFNWRTVTEHYFKLCAQKSFQVDVRGSIQLYDAANGEYKTVALRVTMRLVNKNFGLGSLEPAAAMDSEQTFEVSYIKLYLGGKERFEIDKLNYIAKFDGVDLLASVRADLGLN